MVQNPKKSKKSYEKPPSRREELQSLNIGIIFRSRFYLSSRTKLALYYSLIYPYITYCNSTWSSTYVSNLSRIFYFQKSAVRAITNSDYRAHSAPLFAKLGIMDIFQVNSFQISKFMFYCHYQLLPSTFLNLFETSRQVHNKPFAANDHMVQNPPCWRASSLLFPQWDIKTKRPEPVKLDLPLF